ncbi:MAG: reverse transcriptase domain-containing protein [Patescibacteria group bacterium]
MTLIRLNHSYQHIISIENLLEAWKEFIKGKKARKDVQEFERNLMANIISLHRELATKTYRHSPYEAFNISDPKPRNIHKASVRDRLLHHAIYRILSPFFDRTFIAQSYSCRFGKGTQKAIEQFQSYMYMASKNHTRTVWVLKCDIRKFFASINQKILIKIVEDYIPDKDIIWLISEIVGSFYTTDKGIGLPLGNLTSQLLVNVYMNKFDQFVKHRLKAKYYVRYADDFVIVSEDRGWLIDAIKIMSEFLWNNLRLRLHPKKISIRTVASGNDFLGWVHFSDHRVLRTVTRKRMLKKIAAKKGVEDTVQSYLGLLSHGNMKELGRKIREMISRG